MYIELVKSNIKEGQRNKAQRASGSRRQTEVETVKYNKKKKEKKKGSEKRKERLRKVMKEKRNERRK